MSAPTDADRARIREHLDRGLTPRPEWFEDAWVLDNDGVAWWSCLDEASWRDFERAPCVCHHGAVIVEVADGTFGWVATGCPRCNSVAESATVDHETENT